MENYARVWATVDLDCIVENIENMKANVQPGTKIIGVIKADGYGHGAVPIARELERMSYVWGFAVATVEEALILRGSGLIKPILILGFTFPYSYEMMVEANIHPTVFQLHTLREMSECALKKGKKMKVHIKVDTGMSRIGIKPDDSGLDFLRKAQEIEGIEIEGIFTHFARADEEDKAAAKEQLGIYSFFLQRIQEELDMDIPIKHCSNSAGILQLREANMDAVRAGIALYGLWPSMEVSKETVSLRPALSLRSHIVYLKEIEKGTAVSYGGTWVAERATRIATIPIGYGDGYPRSLSNRGHVLIKGKKASIVGRICMDQFMVDVTDIEGVRELEEVVLIGSQGRESITMEELGEISGRFNYELACNLGKRIPRVYTRNGKVVDSKDYYQDFS